ncbi:MAG: hypothetical protein RIS44_1341 [Pseudomonadota bacterium]
MAGNKAGMSLACITAPRQAQHADGRVAVQSRAKGGKALTHSSTARWAGLFGGGEEASDAGVRSVLLAEDGHDVLPITQQANHVQMIFRLEVEPLHWETLDSP